MGKIAIKLVQPANTVLNDDGVKFAPYETHFVEDSERIQKLIKHRLLERDRDAEAKTAEEGKATEFTADRKSQRRHIDEKG